MHHSQTVEAWTNPRSGLAPAFHHMSYAVFRTDRPSFEILATRCPDGRLWPVGGRLSDALHLSDEAVAYLLGGTYEDQPPLFVRTDRGIGILSKQYDRHAGLGLYLHVHAHPQACARLLTSGALGSPATADFLLSALVKEEGGAVLSRDAEDYEALCDAWSAVRHATEEGLIRVGADDVLYRYELEEVMRSIASFVGCGIEFVGESRVTRVRLYRPPLLEILLLTLLSEVRASAATRVALCTVSSIEGKEGGGLSLTLRYPVEAVPENEVLGRSRRDETARYLARVADIGGIDLQEQILKPTRRDRAAGRLPEVCVTLEWLRNPALLPTSDLKAKLLLKDKEDAEGEESAESAESEESEGSAESAGGSAPDPASPF